MALFSVNEPLFHQAKHVLDLAEPPPITSSDLESVDLVVRLLEHLAAQREPVGVSEVARRLAISKPRAHRHLRALVQRGYARQDARTERYEIGVKVLALGEAVRDRFDVAGAIRPVMGPLREATGLAVTGTALIEGRVTVVEMLQGKTLIEFAIRPGSQLDFHASAHGLIALAFGPSDLLDEVVRAQGWATAVDAVQVGVNALAAPVFDHRGDWRGALALVGATQFIPEAPAATLVEQVRAAAAAASRRLGWEG